MLEIKIYPGDDFTRVIQVITDSDTTPKSFLFTDGLTASLVDGQNVAASFTPTATWFMGLSAINVLSGGESYSDTPTITISGGGATTDATARATVVDGVITVIDLTDPGDGYTSEPTVTITDGTGSSATAEAVPGLGWQTGLVQIDMTGAQTFTLSAPGVYRLKVVLTRSTDPGTQTATIIDCFVNAMPVPGSATSPTPPDLITYDYAETYCAVLGLSNEQVAILPFIIASASQAVRRWCFDRNFDLRTYTEFQDVPINGQVRLLQPPIQIVQRVQGEPRLALTIQNTSTSVQFAQAYFAYSGTWLGYTTNAQTPTGIVLASTSSGVPSSSTVTFTSNQTISSLATAINLVGGGWTATADSTFGAWPVTELDGGYTGQGAAIGALPGWGAQFNVLLDLAPGMFSMDTRRMGFLYVGSSYGSTYNAGRWGPGGDQMWGSPTSYCSRIKVTYMGGESVIPTQVQIMTAELVKWALNSAKTDWLLKSETAQEYSYQLASEMLGTMPKHVAQGLSQFRIPRA